MSDLFSQPEFEGSVEEDGVEDPAGDPGEEESYPEDEPEPGNSTSGGAAKAVLEHVSTALVEDAEAVVIEVGQARQGVKLSLHVSPGDMGRVIGRRGRTAQALRTLVRAAAASEGTDAIVDIVD